jgi:hypothetical protein
LEEEEADADVSNFRMAAAAAAGGDAADSC